MLSVEWLTAELDVDMEVDGSGHATLGEVGVLLEVRFEFSCVLRRKAHQQPVSIYSSPQKISYFLLHSQSNTNPHPPEVTTSITPQLPPLPPCTLRCHHQDLQFVTSSDVTLGCRAEGQFDDVGCPVRGHGGLH